MKKSLTNYEMENRRTDKGKLAELRLFQELLIHHKKLNERFQGKERAIAAGLQPWIDALENILKQ